jgi:hypothetical protein
LEKDIIVGGAVRANRPASIAVSDAETKNGCRHGVETSLSQNLF